MPLRHDVRRAQLPRDSALWPHVAPRDFLDCYAVRAETTPRIAAEIITNFPGWAQALLQLRTLLVTPFGLSTDGPDAPDKIGPRRALSGAIAARCRPAPTAG